MTIQEILEELEFNYGVFPREALKQAIANREQLTPHLLSILEQARQNVQELARQEAYIAHLYAMYLLAQFREKRAYPLIADFFSIPGEITLDLTGDFVTEDLGRVLASVSGGDTRLMKRLAEDENVNEWVRGAALSGLLSLVACGAVSREEIMTYFQSLFRQRLERKPSHIWGALVSSSCDLYPEEVFEDIRQAFADGLVDEIMIDFEWAQKILARGKKKVLGDLRKDRHLKLVQDTISEMEWWACFKPSPPPPPVIMPGRKVGRNEPCPCGSGQKYKRCHGARR